LKIFRFFKKKPKTPLKNLGFFEAIFQPCFLRVLSASDCSKQTQLAAAVKVRPIVAYIARVLSTTTTDHW